MDRAGQLAGWHTALFTCGDDHRQQHAGRCVDGHADADLVQRDAVKQRFHVGQRFDRYASLADLARRQRIVAVVADLGRQIEGDAQAGLSLAQQVLEALVGFGGGAVARVLAHGPEAAAVHRRLHAAGEGVLAGEAELVEIPLLLSFVGRLRAGVQRRVEPLERLRLRPLRHTFDEFGQVGGFPGAQSFE